MSNISGLCSSLDQTHNCVKTASFIQSHFLKQLVIAPKNLQHRLLYAVYQNDTKLLIINANSVQFVAHPKSMVKEWGLWSKLYQHSTSFHSGKATVALKLACDSVQLLRFEMGCQFVTVKLLLVIWDITCSHASLERVKFGPRLDSCCLVPLPLSYGYPPQQGTKEQVCWYSKKTGHIDIWL